MLSHAAPPFCTFEKCFRMLRRRFTPLQNAFACCAAILHPCKVLSHAAPPFCMPICTFFQGAIDFQFETPVL